MKINLTNQMAAKKMQRKTGNDRVAAGVPPDMSQQLGLCSLLFSHDAVLPAVPAAELLHFDTGQRSLFANLYGIYQYPTTELVDFLGNCIAGRSAIEIGAGNGGVSKALGIPATDSYVQEFGADPMLSSIFQVSGTQPAHYGPHVERLAATEAVAAHRPQVVVGCWVTQRAPVTMEVTGYHAGVNHIALLLSNSERHAADEFILVGHERVHGGAQVLRHPRLSVQLYEAPPWLVSRTRTPHHNTIWRITRK